MDVREKLVEILKQAPFEGKVLDEWWWEEKIARIADHLIAHGVTVQEWIPVKERLPEVNERILIYEPRKAGYSDFDICIARGWYCISKLHEVTHYMPIPEPPKGE